MMRGQRTLEINPDHPLIVGLKDKMTSDKNDESAKATAALLYETALLESGFELDDPKVCRNIDSMIVSSVHQLYLMLLLRLGLRCWRAD